MEATLRTLRSEWRGAVLVCAKCTKKLDGGFGKHGGKPLAKLLRKALGLGKGRRAAGGVVEVKCLGVCPKAAVVVVDTRTPDRWLVVPKGADVEEVGAQLERQSSVRAERSRRI